MTNLNIILPPDSRRQRYSKAAFPSYRFVPGLLPHPTENSEGHSYKKPEIHVSFDPKNWQKSEQYLYGVDLYNFAFWWESHEAFEGIWKHLEKNDPGRNFFQGLIQISAAFLKWHIQERRGARELYKSAMNYLKKAESSFVSYAGVDLKSHREKLEKHFEKITQDSSAWPDIKENYPFIVLEA